MLLFLTKLQTLATLRFVLSHRDHVGDSWLDHGLSAASSVPLSTSCLDNHLQER